MSNVQQPVIARWWGAARRRWSPESFLFAAILTTSVWVAVINAFGDEPAPSRRLSDYLGRLNRVNDGYVHVLGEFERVATRVNETRQKIQQSQVTSAQLTQSAAITAQRLGAAREQLAALTAPNPGAAAGGNPGQRNIAANAQIMAANQLNVAIAQFSNELIRLNTSLTQEQGRLATLNADLARAIQQHERTRQQGQKQIDEYWRLADPWGRYCGDEQRAAVAELTKLLDARPDNVGLLFVRGVAYRRLEESERAEADLSRVIEVEGPLQAVAFAARGELRIASGREREGKTDVGRATTMTKRKPDPRVLLYRGWLLCGLDKFELAETEFAKALRIGGVDADAHRFLALIAATRPSPTATEKQRTDAVENAQRACDLTKSEDWLSFEALAAARAAAGQFEEALTAARRATELASGENRQRCEERAKLYEAQQPLRLDWPRATRFAAGL